MFQELTGATGAQAWAIGSLIFFLVVFAGIALRTLTRRTSHYEQRARLPLEDRSEVNDG